MNKVSPFVMMFSKSYGYFGIIRPSYNLLHITNSRITSFYVNNYGSKYHSNGAATLTIRYYSAQPKKQSTILSEYDKIQCKGNKNDSTGAAANNNKPLSNLNDLSHLNKTTGVLSPESEEKNDKNTESTQAIVDPLDPKPEGLFQKFKKMYKEYWYVLLPVHIVTSAFWFGSFYYVSHSGVDIPGLMESIGFSEFYIKPLRNSKLGHVAIAYLLYKVATPIRYTVTLGGTTFSIKYLVNRGYIKPVPTRDQLIKKYKDRMVVRRESKK